MLKDGATWRVREIEGSDMLNLTLVEERTERGTGAPREPSGPRTIRCNVLPKTPFEEVVQ